MMSSPSGEPKSEVPKKPSEINIGYDLMDQKWDHKIQQGSCRARIPSNIPRQYGPMESLDSRLIFDLKDGSNGLHCVEIMTDCAHENILHSPIVEKNKGNNYISVWHEPYMGNLLAYLESTSFGAIQIYGKKVMLPTPELQDIISQIFDGLEALRLRGKYHGNFTLEQTYYHKKGNRIVVKLANFQVKDKVKSVPVCQAEDLQAVGDALSKISKIAKHHKDIDFDCSQIDHLAKELKEFAFGDLCNIKEKIGGRPFFWFFDDRKFLFTSSIPMAMNSRSFRQKIQGKEDLIAIPWDNDDYEGLISLMEKYQKDRKMKKFDRNSRVDYVLCVCGLYAHEGELKVKVKGKVDQVVMRKNPGLCLRIYSMLP